MPTPHFFWRSSILAINTTGQAVELNATLKAPLLTTAWVLTEFANAIAGSRARKDFAHVLGRLRNEPEAEILPPDMNGAKISGELD